MNCVPGHRQRMLCPKILSVSSVEIEPVDTFVGIIETGTDFTKVYITCTSLETMPRIIGNDCDEVPSDEIVTSAACCYNLD